VLSPSDYFGDPATIAASAELSSATPDSMVTSTTLSPPPLPATLNTDPTPGKVQRLGNLSDFLQFIDSAPLNSLVVVKFFGQSCPLCRKIEIKYKKMASYYGSVAPIQFAEIEKRAHPPLFATLGIESFPYIQIYRNGQCVASHGTESDTTFEPMVKDTIERELLMSVEDWSAFLTVFAAPIQATTAKLDTLRDSLSSV
jgi:thiol-disulfide isomerase/thioredoxin